MSRPTLTMFHCTYCGIETVPTPTITLRLGPQSGDNVVTVTCPSCDTTQQEPVSDMLAVRLVFGGAQLYRTDRITSADVDRFVTELETHTELAELAEQD